MDLFGQKLDFSGKKRTILGAFFKRSAIRSRSDKADLLGNTALVTGAGARPGESAGAVGVLHQNPGRGEGGGLRAGVGAGALRVKSWGPPSWGGPGKGAPSWGAATLGPGVASRGAVGASSSPSTRATSLLNIFMHSTTGGGEEEGASRGAAGGGGCSQACMDWWAGSALQAGLGLKQEHCNWYFGC